METKRIRMLPAALIALMPLVAHSEEPLSTDIRNTDLGASNDDCASQPSDRDPAAEVQRKFAKKVADLKSEVEREADDIREDAPNPNQVEGAIGIDFHFRDETADIRFDSPVIVFRDQRMSMDLPEVTMKTQTLSWDNPTLVMRTKCTQGIPETVIDGFNITVRAGKQICIDIPTMEMRREQIKLDVPEVSMRRQDWVMGVPEIKMVTQRIVFTYPALVVDNIEAKTGEMRDRSTNLQNSASARFGSLQSEMTAEIQRTSLARVNQSFECQTATLKRQMRTAYDDLEIMLATSVSSFKLAKDKGASAQVLQGLEASVNSLSDAKLRMITDYVAARRSIAAKKREALENVKQPQSGRPVQS